MVKGSIICIGTAVALKRAHGGGCQLTVTCPFDEVTRSNLDGFVDPLNCPKFSFIKSFVTCRRDVRGHTSVVYEFDGTVEAIASLVQELDQRKAEFGIINWGISQATLDDVFLQLCGNAGHEG